MEEVQELGCQMYNGFNKTMTQLNLDKRAGKSHLRAEKNVGGRKKDIEQSDKKIRDLCHLTGKFRSGDCQSFVLNGKKGQSPFVINLFNFLINMFLNYLSKHY